MDIMMDYEKQAREMALEMYRLNSPEKTMEELSQLPEFQTLVEGFIHRILEPNLPPSGE